MADRSQEIINAVSSIMELDFIGISTQLYIKKEKKGNKQISTKWDRWQKTIAVYFQTALIIIVYRTTK